MIFKWNKVCETCEVLKQQLEQANALNRQLLNKILEKPDVPVREINEERIEAIMPRVIPWNIQKQMLENEDRKAAAVLKEREKEIETNKVSTPVVSAPSTNELEKELLFDDEEETKH